MHTARAALFSARISDQRTLTDRFSCLSHSGDQLLDKVLIHHPLLTRSPFEIVDLDEIGLPPRELLVAQRVGVQLLFADRLALTATV